MSQVARQAVLNPLDGGFAPPQKESAKKQASAATIALPATPEKKSFSTVLWTTVVIAILAYGYANRNTDWIVPYEGKGYWIGVAGGSLLLLQLVYSFVKRLRSARKLASAPWWFNLHIFTGVAGPILILYHSNFSLGAKNSNVALAAMAAVVISGLVGRYIYRHIHFGMSSAVRSTHSMLDRATTLLTIVEADVGTAGGSIAKRLSVFAEQQLKHRRSLTMQFIAAATSPLNIALARIRIKSLIRAAVAENAPRLNWSATEAEAHRKLAGEHVNEFLNGVVAASQFGFWERLFSAWHLFHLPLFFLLIVTGIAHVVSVHWY